MSRLVLLFLLAFTAGSCNPFGDPIEEIQEDLQIRNWLDAVETGRESRSKYSNHLYIDAYLEGWVENQSDRALTGLVLAVKSRGPNEEKEKVRIEIGDLGPGERVKFRELYGSTQSGSFMPRNPRKIRVVEGRYK